MTRFVDHGLELWIAIREVLCFFLGVESHPQSGNNCNEVAIVPGSFRSSWYEVSFTPDVVVGRGVSSVVYGRIIMGGANLYVIPIREVIKR